MVATKGILYEAILYLIDTITDKITMLKENLARRCKNVIFVQLVGIDISRYNRDTTNGFWYYQQIVINEAMPILAHTINFINKADNVVGPWLTATVHDYVNGNLYSRYGKLRDGLHPSNEMQEKWARLFVKSFRTNYMIMQGTN